MYPNDYDEHKSLINEVIRRLGPDVVVLHVAVDPDEHGEDCDGMCCDGNEYPEHGDDEDDEGADEAAISAKTDAPCKSESKSVKQVILLKGAGAALKKAR